MTGARWRVVQTTWQYRRWIMAEEGRAAGAASLTISLRVGASELATGASELAARLLPVNGRRSTRFSDRRE